MYTKLLCCAESEKKMTSNSSETGLESGYPIRNCHFWGKAKVEIGGGGGGGSG